MNYSNEVQNTNQLPKTHEFSHQIDLKTNKKASLMIQVIFVFIALIMVTLAIAFQFPIQSELKAIPKIIITIGLVIIYMVVHELTHGIFIRILSKKKPKYAVRFPYLTTGSQSFFNKKSFVLITLAPVIIWGIILLFVISFVPQTLFMSFYVVLGLNFAGAAGDYVQVYYFFKLPKNALLQDDGNETKVYVLS